MFAISVCGAIGLVPLLCASASGQTAGPTPEALAARLVALPDRGRAPELLKNPRYKHPFYGAPFVLVGDPF